MKIKKFWLKKTAKGGFREYCESRRYLKPTKDHFLFLEAAISFVLHMQKSREAATGKRDARKVLQHWINDLEDGDLHDVWRVVRMMFQSEVERGMEGEEYLPAD